MRALFQALFLLSLLFSAIPLPVANTGLGQIAGGATSSTPGSSAPRLPPGMSRITEVPLADSIAGLAVALILVGFLVFVGCIPAIFKGK